MPIEELKRVLLPSDLPEGDAVSIHDATCWLSGLPSGSLSDPRGSDPKSRCRRDIGRSLRSAQMWSVVLEFARNRNQGDKLLRSFPWGEFKFMYGFVPPEAQRAASLDRLEARARTACAKVGKTPSEILEEWRPIIEFETDRVWWVREALLQLASKLPALVDRSGLSEAVAKALHAPADARPGLRMSLRTGSLDVINDDEKRGVLGIELWTPNSDIRDRTTLISNLEFSRTALVEEFVIAPDRAEAEWVLDCTSTPYWDIQFALGFLKHKGDLKELYRLHAMLKRVGYDTLDFHLNSWISDSEFDATSESEVIIKALRRGVIHAQGVRKGGDRLEPIPTPEWAVLKLVQPPNSDQIVAQDGTGLTPIHWNHLVLERESIVRLLTDGPIRSERSAQSTSQPTMGGTVGEETRAVRWLTGELQNMSAKQLKTADYSKNALHDRIAKNFPNLGKRALARVRDKSIESLGADEATALRAPGRRT